MSVELTAITQPLVFEKGNRISPEEYVAFIARIGKVKDNPAKLIRYLLKNQHWSPFEHVYLTFQVKTTRAIAAQMLRHRSFTFQELSQRYEEIVEILPTELRAQAVNNRQSSTDVIDPIIEIHWSDKDIEKALASELVNWIKMQSMMVYQKLIEAGVARECARDILPLCSATTILMTGNVRSWIHYLAIRDHGHAQKEHQKIAQKIKKIFCEKFPIIAEINYNEESL